MPQKKILLIIVLLFVGIAWFVLDTDKNETTMAVHGKTELLLYSNLDNSFLQALISEYNKEHDRDTVIKLLLPEEREQGKLPDLYLLEHNELQLLSKQQRLYAILSEAGDLLPSAFKDEQSQWFGVFYDPIVFLVNQNYARKYGQENILSWQDIIKLQNVRVAMENLSDSASTRNFLAAFVSRRGEEKTLAYFRGLNRQIPQYSRFPFTPIRLTTVGDADLAITRRSYVFKYLENDFPAYIVLPSEGTPVSLYGVAVDAASKKYESAQLFRDWLLVSALPQKVALEQNTGYIFLLANGLNRNHIEQPEKLWLNTTYDTLTQQEALTNKWLQSARFATK
ncbi:MAG: ABC transporter substrate-binding protein [Acidaminococcaceae bacterium]|nr:ABC transporter substrate-binding protein [Acidaminococcaceae bacterium]